MEDINYEAVHTLKLGYMIISTSDVEAIRYKLCLNSHGAYMF